MQGTRHHWNVDFEWQPSSPRSGRLSAAQVEAFDHDGYLLVEGAFSADELTPVETALDLFEAEADAFLQTQQDGRMMIGESGAIVFAPHAVLQSDAARDFASHPVFRDLCLDLVGEAPRLYWDQLVYKKPEKPRRFPWHQDNGYTFVSPQQYLTCWVPLVDATIDNGCPWVVPGAHVHGTLEHIYVDPLGYECLTEPEGAVAVPAKAGDIVVFSSLTPHLTGPNTTDAVRKTYILQYADDGAEILFGDPAAGEPSQRVTANDPNRQFLLQNTDL